MYCQHMDVGIVEYARRQRGIKSFTAKSARRFPTQLNRYLIAFSYILEESQRQGRPLSVCEIGIGNGTLANFYSHAVSYYGLKSESSIARWIGVDIDISRARANCNYSDLFEQNIENTLIVGQYDIYILLHVLEHLHCPERVMQNVVNESPSQAIFILGVPSHPHFMTGRREAIIRENPNANGHVSTFSRRRVLQLLRDLDLAIEDERAGYLFRWSNSIYEDSKWLQSLNFALGKVVPGFPGEYYVCGRKL